MTPEHYFKQRLTASDFEERGFSNSHEMHPPVDCIYGKVLNECYGITLSYVADETISALSIDVHQRSGRGWMKEKEVLDRMCVYSPAELDFMLNRLPRFLHVGQVTDWKPMLPECPQGIEITYFKEDGTTPSMTQRGCCGPITMWATNDGPWGEKLPLGGFALYAPTTESKEGIASVSASWTIRNKYPLGPLEFSYQPVNPIFSDMSTEIATGDLVVLKSGGPTMTVGKLFAKPQDLVAMAENPIVEAVECHWFPDNSPAFPDHENHWGDPRTQVFPASALKKV